MNAVAALAQRTGAFEARGARSHHEDGIVGTLGRNDFRMPALAPLLAHGRVLGAADRRDGEIAADADIAADAFPDVFHPAFLDLSGQEGVGDRWPGRADEVENAPPNLRNHAVGRSEAADTDDGFGGQPLDEGGERLL